MKTIRSKKPFPAFCAAALLTALSGAGCIFTQASSYETRYYDLANPEAAPQKIMMLVQVDNATPARQRMLYRHADGRITHDEYNLWIQSPEQLLSRCWSNMLPLEGSAANKDVLQLRILLTSFEIDLKEHKVTVAIHYEFRRGDGSCRAGSLRCSEAFREETPAAFSAAFSVCARQLGNELLKIGTGIAAGPAPAGR